MRINVKRFEVWVRIFDYSVDVVIILNSVKVYIIIFINY